MAPSGGKSQQDATLLDALIEEELAAARAECERGEGVDAFEFLKQLRSPGETKG